MSGKQCIVCGKPIRKRTTTWYVRLPVEAREETFKEICGHKMQDLSAREAKPAGTIERVGSLTTIYVSTLPHTKEECGRLTNEQVVSVSRDHNGQIDKFSTWDGESYEDEFFHSGLCAQRQGYASARNGDRYRWSSQ